LVLLCAIYFIARYILKIAVNTRFLLKNKLEGFGWFTFEVFQRIAKQHPEHEFIFFFDRPYDQQFVFAPNVKPVVLFPQARHPFLFYWWFEFSVTQALKKHKADLFISPDGYLSLRTKTPQIAVIHDLNFEHYPKDVSWLVSKYYRRFFPRFAQKAERIITVSEYSKHDIVMLYGVDSAKIDVAYNGASESFSPITNSEKNSFKQAQTKGKNYFIFVGALHPRKNIARLLLAFDAFKKNAGTEHQLLIVGSRYNWTTEMENTYQGMQYKNEVIFCGHLTQDQLRHAYGAAEALLFPSYFEGFGIPLVEAMRSGTPVISSNATALKEVAGDAALLFDPMKTGQLTECMLTLMNTPGKKEELIERGLERAKLFTWDNTAHKIWESVLKLAHAKGLS